MQSYPEHLFYYLLLLLYVFYSAIPWKLSGKKLHACQLQSRRKEKPLPLWAVIISQDEWLATLLQKNPWLAHCSYWGIQTAEQTALISVGKTGWSSLSFSKFLHFLYNPVCHLRRWQLLTLAHGTKPLWCSTQGGTKCCSSLLVLTSLAMQKGILVLSATCPCKCLGTIVPSPCQSQVFMATRCSQKKHEERETTLTNF